MVKFNAVSRVSQTWILMKSLDVPVTGSNAPVIVWIGIWFGVDDIRKIPGTDS